MYHSNRMDAREAATLTALLSKLAGVREAVVVGEEGLVMLKIDLQQDWDEKAALRLIENKNLV